MEDSWETVILYTLGKLNPAAPSCPTGTCPLAGGCASFNTPGRDLPCINHVLGRTMLQGNAFKHFRSAHVSVEHEIQGRNQGPEAAAAGVWLPAPESAEGGRGTVLCAM